MRFSLFANLSARHVYILRVAPLPNMLLMLAAGLAADLDDVRRSVVRGGVGRVPAGQACNLR
jgi:hypothetical protein